jgi:tRNA U34 2-thiouridine synthase MnmA/TrmU
MIPPKEKPESRPRCLLLFSGGLDSALAGLVLQEQGVDIVPVTFKSSFFGYTSAKKMAEQVGWPLVVVDITEEQFRIVENPKYGYGKNMNPCIDCHAHMIRIAGGMLEKYKADFIATGEVLGERPKSQNRAALDTVARESGFEGLVVRPLSAKLLPVTLPEKEGLIDREKLLDISGRSRRRQLELAEKFGLKEYPTPAGGCLLTDPVFSGKLRKLIRWRGFLKKEDVELVKFGRSFFEKDFWIVVSRNESENRAVEKVAVETDILITTNSVPGPLTVLRFRDEDKQSEYEKAIRTASLLTIRYSKARELDGAEVRIKENDEERIVRFRHDEWKELLSRPYIPQF